MNRKVNNIKAVSWLMQSTKARKHESTKARKRENSFFVPSCFRAFVPSCYLTVVVGILFGVASCSGNIAFQDSKAFPSYGWNKDSMVVFNYTATDTLGTYNIIIDVRNDGNYRYQNFWLFVNTVSPDLIEFKDTLEIVLADNHGRWIGKGGGSLHQLPVSFQQQVRFSKFGDYRFELIQGMREDVLEGIHDIGLRIIKN